MPTNKRGATRKFQNDMEGVHWTQFFCAALSGLLSGGRTPEQAVPAAAAAADLALDELEKRG